MLRIYIDDDTCNDEETYQLLVPLDTSWADIQTMVRLHYPTTIRVTIEVTDKDGR